MYALHSKHNIVRIWAMCFVWGCIFRSLQGLTTKTLDVCGDVNYQITCPENTVLIITSVSKLDGTTCKDTSNCPNEERLKDILLKDCFAKSACDMNKTTTVCDFHDGELAVEATCLNDANVVTSCINEIKQLSTSSGPFIVVTPGYPNLYSASQQCSVEITIDSDVSNGQLSIVDRQSQGLNTYLCGNPQQIEVNIISGDVDCPTLTSAQIFPKATVFRFFFHIHESQIRGIAFEVTADNVIQDDSIVPFLLEEQPPPPGEEVETKAEEDDTFFTPLVIVGITAGAALFVLILILVCGVSCRCCCKGSSEKQNKPSKPKSKATKKSKADAERGAEAFFAGAKVEPPYDNNRDVNKQSRDPPKQNGDSHLYQNTSAVHTVTVVADVHRERTRPRSKRKPMKLPRRSKPPSARLQPIYENQSLENNSLPPSPNGQAGYENVGYNNTT